MGSTDPFVSVPLAQSGAVGNAFIGKLPVMTEDFEYYIRAQIEGDNDPTTLVYPPGAPSNVQTVVVQKNKQ